MYNFWSYFLAVYLIVFGAIVGWFIVQFRMENHYINDNWHTKSE